MMQSTVDCYGVVMAMSKVDLLLLIGCVGECRDLGIDGWRDVDGDDIRQLRPLRRSCFEGSRSTTTRAMMMMGYLLLMMNRNEME